MALLHFDRLLNQLGSVDFLGAGSSVAANQRFLRVELIKWSSGL